MNRGGGTLKHRLSRPVLNPALYTSNFNNENYAVGTKFEFSFYEAESDAR